MYFCWDFPFLYFPIIKNFRRKIMKCKENNNFADVNIMSKINVNI